MEKQDWTLFRFQSEADRFPTKAKRRSGGNQAGFQRKSNADKKRLRCESSTRKFYMFPVQTYDTFSP